MFSPSRTLPDTYRYLIPWWPVGLVDITTRADIFNNSGSVGIYGGSQGTLTPSFEYGGTFGSTCPSAAPGEADTDSLKLRLLCRRPILFHRPLSADQ